jgi:hypothetical protein
MTDIAEPVVQLQTAETTTEAPNARTPHPPTTQSKVVLLIEYLTPLPAKLRLATYNTVVAAVKRRELPGIVHLLDKGEMVVVNGDGKEVTRQYAHVMLKNTTELGAQLDQLGIVAINSELVRSHGRSMSVAEMLDMGDELDFDAIIAAVHEGDGRAKAQAGQRKPTARAKVKKTR